MLRLQVAVVYLPPPRRSIARPQQTKKNRHVGGLCVWHSINCKL